jgi:hypothetical protein
MNKLVNKLSIDYLSKLIFENEEFRNGLIEIAKKNAPQIIGAAATILTLSQVKEILHVLKDKKISFLFEKDGTKVEFKVD